MRITTFCLSNQVLFATTAAGTSQALPALIPNVPESWSKAGIQILWMLALALGLEFRRHRSESGLRGQMKIYEKSDAEKAVKIDELSDRLAATEKQYRGMLRWATVLEFAVKRYNPEMYEDLEGQRPEISRN